MIKQVAYIFYIRNPGQKAEVSLRLSEGVLALKEPGEEDIPKQHRLDVTTVTRQMLGVFSHVTRKYLKCNIILQNSFYALLVE